MLFPGKGVGPGFSFRCLKGFQGTTPLPIARWQISFSCVVDVKTLCADALVHVKRVFSRFHACVRCFGPFSSSLAARSFLLHIYDSW